MWNVILFIVLLVLHFILYFSFQQLSVLSRFGNAFQALALILAAIQFTRAAKNAQKEEVAFRNLMASGFWIWVMGHGLLAYSELLLKQPATGTVADAIWLIGYGLIIRALYIRARQFSENSELLGWVSAIVLMILILVCMTLWPIMTDPDRTLLYKFIQFIFPFMDFLIMALAFLVARKSGQKRWLLGAFGSLIIGICDLIFPYNDILSSPVYRYMDIPLFVGYSMWWLLGSKERNS